MSSIAPSSQSIHRILLPPWLKGRGGRAGVALILYTLVFLTWTQFHWGGEENISLIGNLAILHPMLLGTLMCWQVAAQAQLDPRLRRAWFLLGLGTFLSFLGEAAWTYLENVLRAEPFPSIADIFFLGSYPLILWGLFTLPGASLNSRERLIYLFDLVIIMTSASMFVGYFLIVPTVVVNDSNLLAQILATAYPVCSLILLCGILALLIRPSAADSQAVLLWLLTSFGFFLTSDLAFGYASLAGTYIAGTWIDAGWHIAMVFMVLAALRQFHPEPVASTNPNWILVLNGFVKRLPWLTIALGYGLVLYVVTTNYSQVSRWLFVAAVLLTILIIARQIFSSGFSMASVRTKLILTFLLVCVISIGLVSFFTYLTWRSNGESAGQALQFATLIVLILTTGIAVLLSQLFVAPISRLTAVAKQIAAGDLSAKARVESQDEVGVLAATFNTMLETLSRTQQELQESEAHYRNLVDYLPDMIAVERAGKYVFINPAGAKLLGAKSPHELIGQPVLSMIPRQDGESALQRIEETQDLRELISSLQPKMQRLDGTSFEAEIRAISISHAGEPAIQLVVRDITDRKQAEEKIRELLAQVARQRGELEIRVEERTAELNTVNQRLQEELAERQRLLKSLRDRERQLAQAVTLTRIAYWELDLRTTEFTFNDQFYNVLRTTVHKVGGYSIPAERYLRQFVHPEDVERIRERMQAAHNPTSNMGQLEYRCICGDGQIQHALLEYQIVFDKGHPSRIFGAHMDITEREQLVQSLRDSKELAEAASRAKSDFLSRMSHELRTPMNAILGFAQLLEMSHKEPLTSNQKERVKQIVKGGQHLLDLINEILDIARIEANRLQVSPEPVSVRDSIHEAVDLAVPLAVKRHIQVVTKLSRVEESAFVMADRQRFKQILLNLLSNAVKYNYDGGSVILTCQQRPSKKWRISIADTGPGISQEQMGRLFQPFERLVADESSVEGTGLGLTLAKRLVELMHGQIGVDSAPGSGSTFWIELPATESPVEHLQRMGGTGELPLMSATSQTILYVEDNVANFELIREVFADYSQIDLLWAADPKSGIESALQHHPNLILLDLHFGDRDGSEVLQQLKQNEATAGIPVVIVSADATPRQAERLIALGAHAYLTKPLNVKHFIRLMEELLGEKAA